MNSHQLLAVSNETFSGDVALSGNGALCNVSIGDGTQTVNGQGNIAIGDLATAGSGPGNNESTAVGYQSIALAAQCVALGANAACPLGTGQCVCLGVAAIASAGATHALAVGPGATISGDRCMAIGPLASASATNAIAFGRSAVNSVASSCLIGDSAIANIRSNSSTNACDLGTSAAPFKSCWLRDASPAAGSKFSMYSPVTVTNTVAETPILTGTSVGSLVYSAGQSLGSVIRFKIGTSITVGVADTVVVRLKINGVTAVSQTLGGGVFAGVPGAISCDCVVQAANIMCELNAFQDGGGSNITLTSPAYNPAIANTFSFTAQWSAASPGDSFSANYCYIETMFAQ